MHQNANFRSLHSMDESKLWIDGAGTMVAETQLSTQSATYELERVCRL